MRAVFKKTNYSPTNAQRNSLQLEPTGQENGVFTPRILKAVGPEILGPKFGGTGGISPRAIDAQSRKTATYNEDQYADMSPRSKAQS
jgi:hypothetical protein